MSDETVQTRIRPPRRSRTRFFSRHVISSDKHGFVGRVYDLSMIGLHFDSYDELSRYSDCKYAYDTNYWLSNLVTRVESLNMAGNMLWLDPVPKTFGNLPLTRYEWLSVATDVFLMRYVSVIDCSLLLVNQVFRLGLAPTECTMPQLRRKGLPSSVNDHLRLMRNEQETLRLERNARIHHGDEREFTDDDHAFKTASLLCDRYNGVRGSDQHGRRINVDRSFKEGLVGLQRDFNKSTRLLQQQLIGLYDLLWKEFEDHFGPLIRAATQGLNAGAKSTSRPTGEADDP
jgi:hypothetical protein